MTKLESNTYDALLETLGKEGTLSPEIKQACMMLGIAVMSDIRMVVREELKRFGEDRGHTAAPEVNNHKEGEGE